MASFATPGGQLGPLMSPKFLQSMQGYSSLGPLPSPFSSMGGLTNDGFDVGASQSILKRRQGYLEAADQLIRDYEKVISFCAPNEWESLPGFGNIRQHTFKIAECDNPFLLEGYVDVPCGAVSHMFGNIQRDRVGAMFMENDVLVETVEEKPDRVISIHCRSYSVKGAVEKYESLFLKVVQNEGGKHRTLMRSVDHSLFPHVTSHPRQEIRMKAFEVSPTAESGAQSRVLMLQDAFSPVAQKFHAAIKSFPAKFLRSCLMQITKWWKDVAVKASEKSQLTDPLSESVTRFWKIHYQSTDWSMRGVNRIFILKGKETFDCEPHVVLEAVRDWVSRPSWDFMWSSIKLEKDLGGGARLLHCSRPFAEMCPSFEQTMFEGQMEILDGVTLVSTIGYSTPTKPVSTGEQVCQTFLVIKSDPGTQLVYTHEIDPRLFFGTSTDYMEDDVMKFALERMGQRSIELFRTKFNIPSFAVVPQTPQWDTTKTTNGGTYGLNGLQPEFDEQGQLLMPRGPSMGGELTSFQMMQAKQSRNPVKRDQEQERRGKFNQGMADLRSVIKGGNKYTVSEVLSKASERLRELLDQHKNLQTKNDELKEENSVLQQRKSSKRTRVK